MKGANILSLSNGFHYIYLLRHDLENKLVKILPLIMLTDLRSLFKTFLNFTTTSVLRKLSSDARFF